MILNAFSVSSLVFWSAERQLSIECRPGPPKLRALMEVVPTYSWRSQSALGAIINAVLNGGFGYLVLAAGERMPLWGLPSASADLLAMTFGIAFGTGLGVTTHVRSLVLKGRLQSPQLESRFTEAFAKWPPAVFRRSMNLGVLATVIFSPLPFLVLWLAFPDGLSRPELVVFKTVVGFIEGALVTPVVGLAAFHGATADTSHER